ncbi:MAG: GGDEF domain-containing protein, partial [Myxococcota bacterium]
MNERRSFIERLFEADFMPHGHCFLWNPEVLWMHVISDAVTAVSYLSIPVALLVVHRRRRDLAEARVLALFAAFIFLCGLSHI